MKSECSQLTGNRKFKIAFDARAAQAKGVGVATCANTIIKELAKVEDEFEFVFIVDSKLDVSHIVFPPNSEIISTRVGRGSFRSWKLVNPAVPWAIRFYELKHIARCY